MIIYNHSSHFAKPLNPFYFCWGYLCVKGSWFPEKSAVGFQSHFIVFFLFQMWLGHAGPRCHLHDFSCRRTPRRRASSSTFSSLQRQGRWLMPLLALRGVDRRGKGENLISKRGSGGANIYHICTVYFHFAWEACWKA